MRDQGGTCARKESKSGKNGNVHQSSQHCRRDEPRHLYRGASRSHPHRMRDWARECLATCYTGVPPMRPSYPPTASLSPRPLTGQDKKGPSPCPTSPPSSRPTTTTSLATG